MHGQWDPLITYHLVIEVDQGTEIKLPPYTSF